LVKPISEALKKQQQQISIGSRQMLIVYLIDGIV
jgi:hypothetical protein